MHRPHSEEIDRKCVCEICTCGKHRCPIPRVKGDFSTSYGNHYKAPPPAPVPTYSPYQPLMAYPDQSPRLQMSPAPVRSVPFIAETQYAKNYKALNPEDAGRQKRRIIQTVAHRIINPAKFEGSSSYKDHFKGYQLPQQKPLPYDPPPRVPVPFEGETTYKREFKEIEQKSPLPPKEVWERPKAISEMKRVPFVGQSSYNQHYKAHEMQSPQPPRVMANVFMPKEGPKFQGQSSYKDHFKGHEHDMLSKLQSPCPCTQIQLPVVNYNERPHLFYNQNLHAFE